MVRMPRSWEEGLHYSCRITIFLFTSEHLLEIFSRSRFVMLRPAMRVRFEHQHGHDFIVSQPFETIPQHAQGDVPRLKVGLLRRGSLRGAPPGPFVSLPLLSLASNRPNMARNKVSSELE